MSKCVSTPESSCNRYALAEIPWASAAEWASANRVMQHLCVRHRDALAPVRQTARLLKGCLEALFPALDHLCGLSCATCPAPCCHAATVWFDYRDLIFMHLSQQALAIEQLSRGHEGACHCCDASGCRLPRLSRPWTCSWYLCPTQKNLLAKMPGKTQQRFEESVIAVKRLRITLEADFIHVTA